MEGLEFLTERACWAPRAVEKTFIWAWGLGSETAMPEDCTSFWKQTLCYCKEPELWLVTPPDPPKATKEASELKTSFQTGKRRCSVLLPKPSLWEHGEGCEDPDFKTGLCFPRRGNKTEVDTGWKTEGRAMANPRNTGGRFPEDSYVLGTKRSHSRLARVQGDEFKKAQLIHIKCLVPWANWKSDWYLGLSQTHRKQAIWTVVHFRETKWVQNSVLTTH